MKKTAEETLSCEVILKLNNKKCTAQEVFEQVKDVIDQYEMVYGTDIIVTREYKNGDYTSIRLKTDSKIQIGRGVSGIYFILSSDKNHILYVGKSKNLKERLKEHLISCSASTSSHIESVYDYLLSHNEKSLYYCIMKTDDGQHNAAIEGILLDYIYEHKTEEFFSQCWNSRID